MPDNREEINRFNGLYVEDLSVIRQELLKNTYGQKRKTLSEIFSLTSELDDPPVLSEYLLKIIRTLVGPSPDNEKILISSFVRISDILSGQHPQWDSILLKMTKHIAKAKNIWTRPYNFEILKHTSKSIPAMILYALIMTRRHDSQYREIALTDKMCGIAITVRKASAHYPDMQRKMIFGASCHHYFPEAQTTVNVNGFKGTIGVPKLPEVIQIALPGKRVSDLIDSPKIPDTIINFSDNHGTEIEEIYIGGGDPAFDLKPLEQLIDIDPKTDRASLKSYGDMIALAA
jgi:hypothetical protein